MADLCELHSKKAAPSLFSRAQLIAARRCYAVPAVGVFNCQMLRAFIYPIIGLLDYAIPSVRLYSFVLIPLNSRRG